MLEKQLIYIQELLHLNNYVWELPVYIIKISFLSI